MGELLDFEAALRRRREAARSGRGGLDAGAVVAATVDRLAAQRQIAPPPFMYVHPEDWDAATARLGRQPGSLEEVYATGPVDLEAKFGPSVCPRCGCGSSLFRRASLARGGWWFCNECGGQERVRRG